MHDDTARIDAFFSEAKTWPEELRALRAILLDCGLTEEFKWRGPCYTYDGGNVAVIWGFKENAALGFFKGVLLKDPEGLLVAPGDNSRAVRMFRFTGLSQIEAMETTIRSYVREAIELEKAGAKVDLPKDDIVYPEELLAALEEDPELHEAFEALTPGRKRGYALHFAQPKQSSTRVSRIEKSRDRILAGKGLQER
ncbi:MAG: YdeI/OmpD-associated family protein [Rhizobiaceae bacterium]|nr:YdeI/OmpD-associated family protein [Rhizobiaceae bacterium]